MHFSARRTKGYLVNNLTFCRYINTMQWLYYKLWRANMTNVLDWDSYNVRFSVILTRNNIQQLPGSCLYESWNPVAPSSPLVLATPTPAGAPAAAPMLEDVARLASPVGRLLPDMVAPVTWRSLYKEEWSQPLGFLHWTSLKHTWRDTRMWWWGSIFD